MCTRNVKLMVKKATLLVAELLGLPYASEALFLPSDQHR
jgi:hypothetical protein